MDRDATRGAGRGRLHITTQDWSPTLTPGLAPGNAVPPRGAGGGTGGGGNAIPLGGMIATVNVEFRIAPVSLSVSGVSLR